MIGNARRRELALRRAALIRRAAVERARFGIAMLPVERGWIWAERGFAVWRALRTHPLPWALPLAMIALARPRAGLRLLVGTLALWRAWREAGALLRTGTARPA